MKAEANVTTATEKHNSCFSFFSPECASDCGKSCGTDVGEALGMDSGKACGIDLGKACGMSDSPVSNGDWLEIVPEVVTSRVRFLDTARRIRRIMGRSSDFRTLGSLAPHLFL